MIAEAKRLPGSVSSGPAWSIAYPLGYGRYGTATISRLDWIPCCIVDIAAMPCQKGNIQRPN